MWLDRLIAIKKASGKTLKQISSESGVPIGTLNKLFAGQTKDPKLDTVRSVVHALGYTLDDLTDESPLKTENKTGTTEAVPERKQFTLEESNRLLAAMGFIEEGQDLSDDDLTFLTHIIGLLNSYFSKRGPREQMTGK